MFFFYGVLGIFLIFLLGYYWKADIADAIPLTVSGGVLVLYGLALLNCMSWIDAILLTLVAVGTIFLFLRQKQTDFWSYVKEQSCSAAVVCYVCLVLLLCFCISEKVVTWWDDINFWASDLKSIFYLDGFAGKYGNVSPEFGDYPPGTQMIKWLVLHIAGKGFWEGGAFLGYYFMLFSYGMPIVKKLKGKKAFLGIPFAIIMWLIPGIAEIYGYAGFCSDLVMAYIYGAFLYAVVEQGNYGKGLYYGRLSAYLMVLVLCKSTGFIWAFFGLIFMFAYHYWTEKTVLRDWKGFLCVVAMPVLTGASWLLFCLKMHRVTKTTTTAITYMISDQYGISGYTKDFAKAFVEAFVKYPLHKNSTGIIDLSPLAFLFCLIIFVIFAYRRNWFLKRQSQICLGFCVISGLVFYAVIFVAHITIFANETQYLEPSGMISSIERYGAPFTIGTILFLAALICNKELADTKHIAKESSIAPILCVMLFVLLTTDYQSAFYGLWGYRQDVEEQMGLREEMIEPEFEGLLEASRDYLWGRSTRVLVAYHDQDNHRVKNTYEAYALSPVSVMFATFGYGENPDINMLVKTAVETHAEYFYAIPGTMDYQEIYNQCVKDDIFQYNTLYKVAYEGGALCLYKVNE